MATAAATEVDLDRIRAVLSSLVHERQQLRGEDVDRARLEANRLSIVYWQRKLMLHLAEAHAPRA
jgi:hypothetical protein